LRSLSLIVTNHLSVTISYFVNRSPRLRHRLPRRQGAPATSTKWLIYCVTDSSSAVSFFLVFQNIVESIQAFPSHLSARLFAYQCSSSMLPSPRTNISCIFRANVSVPQPSILITPYLCTHSPTIKPHGGLATSSTCTLWVRPMYLHDTSL
jgi:hypothetical protein